MSSNAPAFSFLKPRVSLSDGSFPERLIAPRVLSGKARSKLRQWNLKWPSVEILPSTIDACYSMLSHATPCHSDSMLCYSMLCYAMLCYAMLCYAMLCYAMLCYAMLCYATLRYATLRYALLCFAMLCYAMLYHAMPDCATLCYAMQCHAMLCYTKL